MVGDHHVHCLAGEREHSLFAFHGAALVLAQVDFPDAKKADSDYAALALP